MIAETIVGPAATTTSIGASTQIKARSGQLGDLIVSELHGRYYETNYRRNLFAAYSAFQVLSVSGTAMTGWRCGTARRPSTWCSPKSR